ncbi:ABC transporter permease [Ancylobacter sp. VNQ12]|uniref:ABC transporter permease n=1 Tax=Ancylobacter sp. VNQ12 TaxID=3400920 RepID=UPI003C05CA3F
MNSPLTPAIARGASRPELEFTPLDSSDAGQIERELGIAERLYNLTWLRRAGVLAVLILAWELYARYLDNALLFPSFTDVLVAWWHGVLSGVLPARVWGSLKVLVVAYAIAVSLAGVLTTLAVSHRLGTDLLMTLTTMFNPLPAIALLPLAMLWFGLGPISLIFVIVHSVLWAVTLNTHTGFLATSQTLRMAGRNYGLEGVRLVINILIPAAFPSILTGLKIGWAFAWRTLIAAELVFGVSGSSGGLGWYIFENRNALETANVFAGLATVILIGLFVEGVIFGFIENRTVKRWGMQH